MWNHLEQKPRSLYRKNAAGYATIPVFTCIICSAEQHKRCRCGTVLLISNSVNPDVWLRLESHQTRVYALVSSVYALVSSHPRTPGQTPGGAGCVLVLRFRTLAQHTQTSHIVRLELVQARSIKQLRFRALLRGFVGGVVRCGVGQEKTGHPKSSTDCLARKKTLTFPYTDVCNLFFATNTP